KQKPVFSPLPIPKIDHSKEIPSGSKQILDEHGPEDTAKWLKDQKKVLLTDTTFRDAHQSPLATRVRKKDLEHIADAAERLLPILLAVEIWGGATFDVSYRFLREAPVHLLLPLREKLPHVLCQILLRASNAVGDKNSLNNLIHRFVEASA